MPVRLQPGFGDPTYLVDVTTGSETYQLPAGYAPGRRITFRRVDGGPNSFTVTLATGESINGAVDAAMLLPGLSSRTFTRSDPGRWTTLEGSTDTSGPLLPDAYVYDSAGNVLKATTGGVATTYTYNADGSVATESRGGRTKTYAYDSTGNITGSAVA